MNEPLFYHELADWWPLLSAPEDYAEEADFYHGLLQRQQPAPRTLLELGSGGGNNASYLKAHYALTLVDRAPGMLEVSRRLNPECAHALGDMRTARLGRVFDAVFIHDAVMYLTEEADLRQAFETAWLHCRPGGAVLISPDCVRETFTPETSHGGHDQGDRGLRYLEWNYDPDPSDTVFCAEFAFLLRESGQVRAVHDTHRLGLFPRAVWLDLLRAQGFQPEIVPDKWGRENFLAQKPLQS